MNIFDHLSVNYDLLEGVTLHSMSEIPSKPLG